MSHDPKGRAWGPLSDTEIAEGLHLARQALEAGKDDPDVLWMAGAPFQFWAAITLRRLSLSAVP